MKTVALVLVGVAATGALALGAIIAWVAYERGGLGKSTNYGHR